MFIIFLNTSDQMDIKSSYVQGERQTEQDPYLDDIGRPLTYLNWNYEGTAGSGLYLRMNEYDRMETSSGSFKHSYICQMIVK